jgi:hypothetical protein
VWEDMGYNQSGEMAENGLTLGAADAIGAADHDVRPLERSHD